MVTSLYIYRRWYLILHLYDTIFFMNHVCIYFFYELSWKKKFLLWDRFPASFTSRPGFNYLEFFLRATVYGLEIRWNKTSAFELEILKHRYCLTIQTLEPGQNLGLRVPDLVPHDSVFTVPRNGAMYLILSKTINFLYLHRFIVYIIFLVN